MLLCILLVQDLFIEYICISLYTGHKNKMCKILFIFCFQFVYFILTNLFIIFIIIRSMGTNWVINNRELECIIWNYCNLSNVVYGVIVIHIHANFWQSYWWVFLLKANKFLTFAVYVRAFLILLCKFIVSVLSDYWGEIKRQREREWKWLI